MGLVSVRGVRLNVEERGSGPVLLLVHGFPLDHTMWSAQIPEFAKNYRVIAPDLRGFGKSGVTEGTVTMDMFADDLAALLEALKVSEPVDFCGLSMGGYIAFAFWAKYAARIRKLVLADTRALGDTPEAAGGRLAMAEKVLKEGVQALKDGMLPKLVGPRVKDDQPEVYARIVRMFDENPIKGIAATLRGLAVRSDFTGRLGEIRVPTLVIVGEHDAISTPAEMRKIAAGIPGAKYQEIPRAGHMLPMERAAEFNIALRDFLA